MFLVGDIGGTNIRLALVKKDRIVKEESFPSKGSLEKLLLSFLNGQSCSLCVLGIAGPVQNGHAEMTNLSWVIEEKKLQKVLHCETILLNDLVATAYGIKMLKKEDFLSLQGKGRGNQALLSPGTGLGEAGLIWTGKEHLPFASEGGHADFAPTDSFERDLLIFLEKKTGHVSYERILSGPGLVSLYHFIGQRKEKILPEEITKRAKKNDPVCLEVLDRFFLILASEAGNLALKFLATGGVFIGGGIVPKILFRLKKKSFIKRFSDKGRFSPLLKKIPLKILQNDKASLLGAIAFAKNQLS